MLILQSRPQCRARQSQIILLTLLTTGLAGRGAQRFSLLVVEAGIRRIDSKVLLRRDQAGLFHKDQEREREGGRQKEGMDRNYDSLVKVLLCGDSGVGKTCLISQFTDGQIRRTHITTIGIDFKLKTLTVDGKRLKMQIWDTAGQERFETLTAQYYRRAQAIMLVYDVTKERTFTNVSKWLRNIEENAVDNVRIVLVGNKIDLENQREVSEKRGKKLADQHGVHFFETSAWANQHVAEPFECLASQILDDMSQKVQVERNGTIKLGNGQSINNLSKQAEKTGCCW